jgi:hypothetical protein
MPSNHETIDIDDDSITSPDSFHSIEDEGDRDDNHSTEDDMNYHIVLFYTFGQNMQFYLLNQIIKLEPGILLSKIPMHHESGDAKITSIKTTKIGKISVYAKPTAIGMMIH